MWTPSVFLPYSFEGTFYTRNIPRNFDGSVDISAEHLQSWGWFLHSHFSPFMCFFADEFRVNSLDSLFLQHMLQVVFFRFLRDQYGFVFLYCNQCLWCNPDWTFSMNHQYFAKIAHNSGHTAAMILRFVDAHLSQHIFRKKEHRRLFAKKRW